MNHDFSTAFLLFIVGMITVFAILTLITLFGKWLILFVNKYFPEKSKVALQAVSSGPHEIDPKKLAAIVTAIEIVSEGKAKISSVKKSKE